jgi:hypothetical protein
MAIKQVRKNIQRVWGTHFRGLRLRLGAAGLRPLGWFLVTHAGLQHGLAIDTRCRGDRYMNVDA